MNGIAMVAAFFMFRMIPITRFYYVLWSHRDMLMVSRDAMVKVAIPTFLFMSWMNYWWFYKMMRGLIKAVQQAKDDKKEKKEK